MISVLIRARPDQPVEQLGATLAALVPAVVHGLVGDAIVLTSQPNADLMRVADAAGVSVVVTEDDQNGWRHAAQRTRGRWILLLAAGDRLEPGWMMQAERALLAFSPRLARLRRRPASLGAAIGQALADIARPRRIAPGLLVTREMLLAAPLKGSVTRLPILIDAVP